MKKTCILLLRPMFPWAWVKIINLKQINVLLQKQHVDVDIGQINSAPPNIKGTFFWGIGGVVFFWDWNIMDNQGTSFQKGDLVKMNLHFLSPRL